MTQKLNYSKGAFKDMYEALVAIRNLCAINEIGLPDALVVQASKAIAKAEAD